MKLIVCAPDVLYDELIDSIDKETKIIRAQQLEWGMEADLVIYLQDDFRTVDYRVTNSPVFINAVAYTLEELALPPHVSRINAWPGFLERKLWEVVANQPGALNSIVTLLGKQIHFTNDEPGMISPRIIAMIVNEAYFALGENVSTKSEIDIAMKLGTNYPAGPFEWSKKIGLEKILHLLTVLSKFDKRYIPAAAMVAEVRDN